VATIVPFDVNRMLTKRSVIVHPKHRGVDQPLPEVVQPTLEKKSPSEILEDFEPISHYAENITRIGSIQWRKRAQVEGRVTSIRASSANSAPVLAVEIWDETGGITLQFFGRRDIAGLKVGAQLRAEGMVGEKDGELTILNPLYELFA